MRWVLTMIVLLAVLTASLPLLRGLTGVLGERTASAPRSDPRTGADGRTANAPATVRLDPPRSVTVYRWRDADGTVHFESTPPPAEVRSEAIEMRGRANARLVEAPRREAGPGGQAGQAGPSAGIPADPLSVYSGKGMDELMDRLDDTLESLDARERTMQELRKDL